jgi:uncharacterized protein YndB with AHSA1/START domain
MGFPDRIERTVPIAHPPDKVGRRSPRPRVWERVEEPAVFGFTWPTYGLPEDDPHRTYVEFTLEPAGPGTRLTVVETGFAQLPEDVYRKAYDGNTEGWAKELGELADYLDAT